MNRKQVIYIPDALLVQTGYASLHGLVLLDKDDKPIAGTPLMGLRVKSGDTLTITFKSTKDAQEPRS